jgi:hypothetical protein
MQFPGEDTSSYRVQPDYDQAMKPGRKFAFSGLQ